MNMTAVATTGPEDRELIIGVIVLVLSNTTA